MTQPHHWRILVGAILAIMVAAFVLPPQAPEPDLRENRKLAPAPAWPRDLAALGTLRTDLDAYVADHFPARAQLIALFNYARLPFGVSGSPRVIIGKQGWLFYDDGSHLGAARGEPPLATADARAWLLGLAGRTEALRARGIVYLVISPPMKESIYPEYGPDWYDGPDPHRPNLRLAAIANLTGVGEVIHFQAPVSRATRAGLRTYGPYDTHWSGAGAYAAYVPLMRRLQLMGVGEAPRVITDFQAVDGNPLRDLAQMLGIGHFLDLRDGLLADPLEEQRHRVTYLTEKKDWTGLHVIDTGRQGKPTLLITVDSFSNALMPFLYSHFSRIIVAHNQDGTWREDLIDRFKPDVVILEVLESGLRFSLNPAPEPSAATIARIDRFLRDPTASQVTLVRDRAVAVPSWDLIMRILAKAEPAPGCNVERAELSPDETDGPSLRLEGWVSHLGRLPAPTTGIVRLSGPGGDYLVPIRTDRRRPDVAARFDNPMAELSGFSERMSLGALPPGEYRINVYRRARKRWIYCTPQVVEIAPRGGNVQ